MLTKFKEIPLSIYKEIEKPVVFGGMNLPSYVSNGAGRYFEPSPGSSPSLPLSCLLGPKLNLSSRKQVMRLGKG